MEGQFGVARKGEGKRLGAGERGMLSRHETEAGISKNNGTKNSGSPGSPQEKVEDSRGHYTI